MSDQPFSDPSIFEVSARQVDYHWSSRSFVFSDADGLHQFFLDYHDDYVPVTVFLREGNEVRARLVWSHPHPIRLSDF